MADASVFQTGFEEGLKRGGEAHARKRAVADEELQQKITDLLNQRDSLQQKYSQVKGTPDEAQVGQDILTNQSAIREFYHPDNNPDAIQKFGSMLMERLHMKKPQPSITTQPTMPIPGSPDAANATDTMAVAKPQGLIQPGNIPIWNRPTVQNADGSHSSEYSVSFADQNGHEVLVPTVVDGKFLTPDGKKPVPGSKEEKEMFSKAWQHYLKTGQNLGVFDNPANADAYAQQLHSRGERPGVVPAGPKVTVTEMTPKQGEKFNKNQSSDQAAAAAVEAAAPLSPDQIAEQERKKTAADLQSQIDTKLGIFDRMFPNAPEEQRTQYKNYLAESILGMKPGQEVGKWTQVPGMVRGQKVTLLYDEKTGTYKYQTGESVSDDDLRNFVPDPKPSKMSANDRLWDSYASSLGKTMDQLTMKDKAGFEGWLNKLKARSTTRQTVIYDRDGTGHIIDLTNISSPVEVTTPSQGGQPGGGAQPAAGATPTATPGARPSGTQPAGSARPNGVAPHQAAAPAAQAGAGRTLPFKKATPAYNKLSTDKEEDQRLVDYADTWINIPAGQRSEADGSFILALVKSKAGRVNQQEINMYFNAGGIAELPERWAAKTGHGELPDALRQQLLTLVHSQLDADNQAMQQMDAPPAGASPATAGALPKGW